MFFMLIKYITNLHKLCKYACKYFLCISLFLFLCILLFLLCFFLEEEFISEVYEIN